MKKLLQILFTFSCTLVWIGCARVPKENSITVTQLNELAAKDTIVLLDVRTPEEIAEGKIKSTALEANFFDADFQMKAATILPKNSNVYVYCKGGNRSAKAVNQLRALGYENVYNVQGGIKAWKAKGYDVE